ncbi:MAG: Co2+/Mg2+ efflux protein ApaG [Proteobacteria bacterium]|nr:Co2+/Mg2+ efflux protein ApaG [Pseudomonadota bacterium]
MYRTTTEGIEITVEPEYAPNRSNPARDEYFWIYAVSIRNMGTEIVQLRSRYWRIVDAKGEAHEIRGVGVVGDQPVIHPGDTYRYASGCPLGTPGGIMSGSYEMMTKQGRRFEAIIPAFSLDVPNAERILN